MIGYYCVTAFQLFLSVFIQRRYFRDKRNVLFIVAPLKAEDYDKKEFIKLGFDDVVEVNEINNGNTDLSFDYLFFFSLCTACSEILLAMKREKLALMYEGITTFQLKNWNSEKSAKVDISLIDEVWIPTKELLIDEEYLNKCKEFSIGFKEIEKHELEEICESLNKVFRYNYVPIENETVFMDRYLTKYTNKLYSVGTERLLVHSIYTYLSDGADIKRHPYDTYYKIKYKGLSKAHVIEDNVPWELIYLNNYIKNGGKITQYIIYNSFAPANQTLLFDDNNYKCICVEPLLARYSDLSDSYLNDTITEKIFNRFSEIYNVEIDYISNPSDLTDKKTYFTDDILWEKMERRMEKQWKLDKIAARSFRLQIDMALMTIQKNEGLFYINANNIFAERSRQILKEALPSFKETSYISNADFCIDCNRKMVDYDSDDFDIKNIKWIEGFNRLSSEEVDLLNYINKNKKIYIWGATKTSDATINCLEKIGLKDLIKNIIDNRCEGEKRGIPIRKYSPDEIFGDSLIIICANLAYKEIMQILNKDGFVESKDYVLGINVGVEER